MNETAITPHAALGWLNQFAAARPLGWTCAELTATETRRRAATYKYALEMVESDAVPPSAARLIKARRTIVAVGKGEGVSLSFYMPLLPASALVCEAIIAHPFLGAVVTGLLSWPVWLEAEAPRHDGEHLHALALYAVIDERPLGDCCDLACINPWMAGIVAPFKALSVFDVVTRQTPRLLADNAPVGADTVLAVAAAALAAEPYGLPPMVARALLLWVADNSGALLRALYLLHGDSDHEPMLFSMLAEWAHASATGFVAANQGFDPSLSVQVALKRMNHFFDAAGGYAS